MSMEIEKMVPELWQLNHDIDSAYAGIHFLWKLEDFEGSEGQHRKYEELKRKKELILKPIFGL